MTELCQVYKCSVCGNMVEVVHTGKGQLACCNKPMQLMEENTVDAAREKHVPAVQKESGRITVTVGSVEHPMEDKHYIEWIELTSGEKVYRQFLNPGEIPRAVFEVDAGNVSVRAYCNLHGLWKSEA